MTGWVLLDLDGVIYRGDSPIKGSVDAIESLNRNHYGVRFLTNNATRTSSEYAVKLKRMGIHVKEDEILTSGRATSLYLRKKFGRLRIYPVGGAALESELIKGGHEISDWDDSDAVVVCLDFNFDYRKLTNASNAIRRGALFIATNKDPTVPIENGYLPGAGSIVSAIEVSSGRNAICVGKPSPEILSIASEIWGLDFKDTVIVGDRIDTDVVLGRRAGLTSVLVLTGAMPSWDPSMAKSPEEIPHMVFKDLKEFAAHMIQKINNAD